ncbi:uncharacterized protein LOC127793964 isoform X2 [Diospyros lotus]|uniref:uncharacterized protein LOC127793964 isoform X2 n=1 Tax=Diospyros lotus TaxID=55363 RepID=UPI00224F745C|nr:uncharacterized protein LOC127793964 isoform X2 [Diospyros lotus]
MDLTSPKYLEGPPLLASNGEPFADAFSVDPLCKLNLKETSEFVKSSFPMANHKGLESRKIRNNVEAPSTPGRPIFSFSASGLSRKSFPSKWHDAEKWLNGSSSCHDSPVYNHHAQKSSEPSKIFKQIDGFRPQVEVFAEKSRVTEEKISKALPSIHGSVALPLADVLLKDKFTNEVVEPKFSGLRCSEPVNEGLLFGGSNMVEKAMKDAATEVAVEVKHKDVGTEMTPLGSSTTSRCHTPFKSSSPARHNTPASRSGPLSLVSSNGSNAAIDIAHLQQCHLAKLQLGTQIDSLVSTWSSREEEEEDISKSLRHSEIGNECRKSVSESRAVSNWEEEEKNKCCLRYQREEAKIQAWVNLQSAKAEAQSRKLEKKLI